MTIEEIQNMIAIEHYDNEEVLWQHMPDHTKLQYWPEVCRRAQIEALEKAAINVRNHYPWANTSPITDEHNIITT